jgi:hypothetical protein
MLVVSSEPGRIDPAHVLIVPESASLKVPYVCIAWTAATYRRSGIARSLLEDIAKEFDVSPQRLAYDMPFSPGGLSLIQQFAGLRFLATTAQLMVIGVPIEHEHWLAECHSRIVAGQGDRDAVQQVQNKLAQAGYFADPRMIGK